MVMVAMVLPVRAELPTKAATQARIEAGDDLGSRARQVLFRVRTRLAEGDASGAVNALNKWLVGHPDRDHHLMRFERALGFLALDQPDSALVDLRQAVALAPKFARGWLKLGEVAYGQQDFALAAEAFGHGYALAPDPQPELLHYQGVCLLLSGQPEKAAQVLVTLLREHRDQAGLDWYQALIAAALESSQREIPTTLLDHMIEDFASEPEAWSLAARYAGARQEYRAAVVCLRIADYLAPLTGDQLNRLGDLYAACGVPLQAARSYERSAASSLRVVARDSVAVRRWREDQERLATAWLAAHQPRQALASLQAAVQTDPGFGRGWLLLGYSALELGMDETARQNFQRAQDFEEQASEAGRLLDSMPNK